MAPEQASEFSKGYDLLFMAILLLTVFFTVIVGALVIILAIKYRAGSKADRSRPQNENLRIEMSWTIPPLLLGLIIFAWGANDFIKFRRPPKNALEIFVIGKQWMWHIQHANGIREMNELHVPVDTPVKLTMISQDVLHVFFVPAFRIQYEVIPGRYTYEWFTATKPGRYYLFCNMYCGTQHSEMGGYVYVMSKADFAKWDAQGGTEVSPGETVVQAGQHLFDQLNCGNCHTDTDTDRAPTLYGVAGKQVKISDGSTMTADDTFLRQSILTPYSHIVSGYTNTMPVYNLQLTEEQVEGLVQYIKSLGPQSPKPVLKPLVSPAGAVPPSAGSAAQTPGRVQGAKPTTTTPGPGAPAAPNNAKKVNQSQ